MSNPTMISAIKAAVMSSHGQARIGHFVEAQILGPRRGYVDGVEVLPPADEIHHIDKHNFKVPFVTGCRTSAGAATDCRGAGMIRTKKRLELETWWSCRHCRAVQGAISTRLCPR
jgi:pyridoxal 5'-phosphate synthase pdxS subunit